MLKLEKLTANATHWWRTLMLLMSLDDREWP